MKFALSTATAAAFALAVPSIAMAQDDAPPAAPAEEAAEADETEDEADNSRRICKTTTITGSRLAKKKTCRTSEEWRKHERDTQASFNQARNRRASANGNQ